MRQEYINHKESIKTVNSTYSSQIPIPDRSLLTQTDRAFVETLGLTTDYPYEFMVNDGIEAFWLSSQSSFNDYELNNNPAIGLNGIDVTIATTNSLKLSSGYRNPERHERVGSTATCSKHILGRAIDTAFVNAFPSNLEKSKYFYYLYLSLKANPPTGSDFFQLEYGVSKSLVKYSKDSSGNWTESSTFSGFNTDIVPIGGNGIPDRLETTGFTPNHIHIHKKGLTSCP